VEVCAALVNLLPIMSSSVIVQAAFALFVVA